MKCHSLVRGVVVCTTAVGEANSSVGIYTEHGLIYAMAYGGRSLKSTVGASNALFTMGRFALEESKGRFYKIYDIFVHEYCYELASSLPCYYAACLCVELVRYLEGTQHEAQFKALVDALLYLLNVCKRERAEHAMCSHAALVVYLFRSLCCNGWHPQPLELSHHEGIDRFTFDMAHGAFVPAGAAAAEYQNAVRTYLLRTYIGVVQQTLHKPFGVSADCVRESTEEKNRKELAIAAQHLLELWQQILERTFRSGSFLSS